MTDIVERLRGMALTQADGDVLVDAANEIENLRNVADQRFKMCVSSGQEITHLRATIDQLRAVAGAVSLDGPTLANIKQGSPQAQKSDVMLKTNG